MVLDIIVIIILLISAGIAFLRGFIREILTICGVVGGLAAAYFFGDNVTPLFENWLINPEAEEPQKLFGVLPYGLLCQILGYGSVFLTVVIVLSVASHLLSGWAKAIGLGAVDRSLGVVFGLLRGFVILVFLYLVPFLLFPYESRAEWFEGARSFNYLEKTTGWAAGLLPESFRAEAKENAEDAKDTVNDTRDTLEKMDILRSDRENGAIQFESGGEDAAEKGYRDHQRIDINRLIEDAVEDATKEPPPMNETNDDAHGLNE